MNYSTHGWVVAAVLAAGAISLDGLGYSVVSPAFAGCCGSKMSKKSGYKNTQANAGGAAAANEAAGGAVIQEQYGQLPLAPQGGGQNIYSNRGLPVAEEGAVVYDHGFPANAAEATLGPGVASTATGAHAAGPSQYGVVTWPAGQGEEVIYDNVNTPLAAEEAELHYGDLAPEEQALTYGDLPPEPAAAGQEGAAAAQEGAAEETAVSSLEAGASDELAEKLRKQRAKLKK